MGWKGVYWQQGVPVSMTLAWGLGKPEGSLRFLAWRGRSKRVGVEYVVLGAIFALCRRRLVEAIDVGGFVGSSMLFFGGLSGPETSLQSAVERGGVVG